MSLTPASKYRWSGLTYTNPAPGTTNTPNVTYQYDANNNRFNMIDGTATTTYSYDEVDRLLSVTSPGPKTVGYRYDADGDRRKVIYPDSTAVTYAFDAADRLQSLTDWATRTTSYTYFPDSRLNGTTNVNGTGASYAYDNGRRLTQVSNFQTSPPTNLISQHTYTLDGGTNGPGNRTQVVEVLPRLGPPGPNPSGQPWAWGLNANGQLGNNSTTTSPSPVQVLNLSGVSAVSGGWGHSLALKPDGTVWAWGRNQDGQLGNNSTTESHVPVQAQAPGGGGSLIGAAVVTAGKEPQPGAQVRWQRVGLGFQPLRPARVFAQWNVHGL